MRAATAVRILLGSLLLAGPGPVLALVAGPDRHDDDLRVASRLLGGRLVVQAAVDVLLRGRLQRLGTAVEAAHAASMVPVAVRSPRHRQTASVSAAVATALALADLSSTTHGHR